MYISLRSKFVMDDWKRTYSNEDTRTKAIPWFWENYDAEGYSIWFGEYKYNDECKKTFMTANLLGGFIQRLDKLRKYGFGSLVIFGDEPNLSVTVCFLFRGKDIPAEVCSSLVFMSVLFFVSVLTWSTIALFADA